MSDLGPPTGEEDGVDLTAAEYVLGVLEPRARRRAAARLEADPTFRAEVEAWEQRLAPLTDTVEPAPPPASLWRRIERDLAPGQTESNVVTFPGRSRPWYSLGLWPAATAASLAAAACVVLLILRPALPTRAPAAPTMVATLSAADGKPVFVTVVDRARRGITVVPVGAAIGAGRWPELWIIPTGGKPRPVGMVGAAKPRLILISSALLAAPTAVLAVSLEPRGGSPTGAPTGPVIATGTLRAL
jgi:anti-sigma-K factor RskA